MGVVQTELGRGLLLLWLLVLLRGWGVGGREIVHACRLADDRNGRAVVTGRGEWRHRPLIFSFRADENVDWSVGTLQVHLIRL